MKCKFCGVEVEDNIKNCPACGNKIKKTNFQYGLLF